MRIGGGGEAVRCVACRGAWAVRGPRTTAPGCATRVPSTSRAGRPSRDRRFSLQHESNPEPLGSTPRQDSPTARLAIRAGRGDPCARVQTSGQQVCGRSRSTSRARVTWGTGWIRSVHAPPFARCDVHFVDDLGGSQRYVLAVRVSSRVRLSETWRVLGRRDDLGALEAERRLLASGLGKRTHSVR